MKAVTETGPDPEPDTGRRAGSEADREWLVLAVAALLAACAGLAVATIRDPWYLTVAIAAAFGIFLVAAAMAVVRPLRRRRHHDF
jgi:Flp pilus assembly protein TadB